MNAKKAKRIREAKTRLPKHLWSVEYALDCPRLVPPAVQLAIVDKDPVPGLEARMAQCRPFHEKQLRKFASSADRIRQLRSVFIEATWNMGFGDVSGDRIALLTSAPGVSHSSLLNAPERRSWLVTKTVYIAGFPVCWCLPFEPRRGKTIHIVLQESNAFDLKRAYANAMGQK